ncbi:predicted protein, partial [Postia placenta Mad-698-R]
REEAMTVSRGIPKCGGWSSVASSRSGMLYLYRVWVELFTHFLAVENSCQYYVTTVHFNARALFGSPALTDRLPISSPTEMIMDVQLSGTYTVVNHSFKTRIRLPNENHSQPLWEVASCEGSYHTFYNTKFSSYVSSNADCYEPTAASKPIPHLATLLSMFAGCWTHTAMLSIQFALWRTEELPPRTFLHLSAFTSIHTLKLTNVTFAAVKMFGQLTCSLPRLRRLDCHGVKVLDTRHNSQLLSRHAASVKLQELQLDGPSDRAVIKLLLDSGMIAFAHNITLQSLRPSDTVKCQLQRLLCDVSTSLRVLTIKLVANEGSEEHRADSIIGTISHHILVLSASLTPTLCQEIDVLSTLVLTDLKIVCIQLWPPPGCQCAGGSEGPWNEIMQLRFPKLRDQGILCAYTYCCDNYSLALSAGWPWPTKFSNG